MAIITILQDWVLWIKNFNLDVCMHINTYNINSGISMNFNKEYVSVTVSTAHTHTFTFTAAIIYFEHCMYRNWMY
jgi:hypothetical protein